MSDSGTIYKVRGIKKSQSIPHKSALALLGIEFYTAGMQQSGDLRIPLFLPKSPCPVRYQVRFSCRECRHIHDDEPSLTEARLDEGSRLAHDDHSPQPASRALHRVILAAWLCMALSITSGRRPCTRARTSNGTIISGCSGCQKSEASAFPPQVRLIYSCHACSWSS